MRLNSTPTVFDGRENPKVSDPILIRAREIPVGEVFAHARALWDDRPLFFGEHAAHVAAIQRFLSQVFAGLDGEQKSILTVQLLEHDQMRREIAGVTERPSERVAGVEMSPKSI